MFPTSGSAPRNVQCREEYKIYIPRRKVRACSSLKVRGLIIALVAVKIHINSSYFLGCYYWHCPKPCSDCFESSGRYAFDHTRYSEARILKLCEKVHFGTLYHRPWLTHRDSVVLYIFSIAGSHRRGPASHEPAIFSYSCQLGFIHSTGRCNAGPHRHKEPVAGLFGECD